MQWCRFLLLAAIFGLSVQAASAGPISYSVLTGTGTGTISATGILFGDISTTSPMLPQGTVDANGTGDFSDFTDGEGFYWDVSSPYSLPFESDLGNLEVLSITESGDTLSFFALSGYSTAGPSGSFDGFVIDHGFAVPNSFFTVTSNSKNKATGQNIFSWTLQAPTPEPGGFALLGTGIAVASSIPLRRRRRVSALSAHSS